MEGWSGGDYASPADTSSSGSASGSEGSFSIGQKRLEERVADLSVADRTAAMIHGPKLLAALRVTHAALLALESQHEFTLDGMEISITVGSGTDRKVIAVIDGEQVMEENDALLKLISKDPDDE